MATDPVCGMYVDPKTATLRLERENRTYYFCAAECLEAFARPEQHRARLARQLAVAWPLALVVAVLTILRPFGDWAWVALALGAVVQGYAGTPFYRGTWDALRARVGNMDLLVAVATTAAFVYSAAVVLLPGRLPPEVFFDASALILALILTGNYLEQRTRSRSAAVVRALRELLPADVVRLRGGTEERVALDLVSVGELVRVPAQGRVPVDGIVRAGRSWADESVVTGESAPQPKEGGDRVVAGSRNGEGVLDVEVTGVGADSFLGTVGRLVTEAEASRMPLRRLAERVAAWFAPLVLGIALAAALGWALLAHAPLPVDVLVFVTVAITACPCAFGIATPAAIAVGAGRAAESGILFRGEETFGALARVDWVIADKTGTVTHGHPRVAEIRAAPGATPDHVRAVASALSAGSDHPFARALRVRGSPSGIVPAAREIRSLPGVGVEGRVDGVSAYFGQASVEGRADPWVAEVLAGADRVGASVSFLREAGSWTGAVLFTDPVAPGVAEVVRALRERGVQVELASGDRPAAAHAVAAAAGIAIAQGGLRPSDKQALVAARRREGHFVAFVGDGVNDAPALTAADVGIAIGTGTEVAREAGGVLLVSDGFSGVLGAIEVARATVRKVRQNLTWAVGYNAVLLPIAAGALVPLLGFGIYTVLPMVGAVAMALSSTSVVANSLSLGRLRLPGSPRGLRPGSPGSAAGVPRPQGG
jgi:Cu+-exporting ATPase